MMRLRLLSLLALLGGVAVPAASQGRPAMSCPDGVTARFALSGADTTTVAIPQAARERQPAAGPNFVDTTWVIAIEARQWSWDDLFASLGAGFSSGGTDPIRICAGATIELERATLFVRGAHGTIHLKLDAPRFSAASRSRL